MLIFLFSEPNLQGSTPTHPSPSTRPSPIPTPFHQMEITAMILGKGWFLFSHPCIHHCQEKWGPDQQVRQHRERSGQADKDALPQCNQRSHNRPVCWKYNPLFSCQQYLRSYLNPNCLINKRNRGRPSPTSRQATTSSIHLAFQVAPLQVPLSISPTPSPASMTLPTPTTNCSLPLAASPHPHPPPHHRRPLNPRGWPSSR